MATFPSDYTKETVSDFIVRSQRANANTSKLSGVAFLDTGTIAIGDLTAYDVDEDQIRLLQFPPKCHLLGPLSITLSDWDTGASGVWSIKVVDVDGTETALSGSLSTVPRAAGVVELVPSDTAGISVGVEVGGQWLVLECDTAPDVAPSSGATVRCKVAVYLGGLIALGAAAVAENYAEESI